MELTMDASGVKCVTPELAVLSVPENRAPHSYEIVCGIEQQTSSLRFTLAAWYPMLHRLEKQKWIRGAWETSVNGPHRSVARGPKPFAALHRLAGVSIA